jgi:single-stranded-DNA-specific exonuclease
MTARTWTLRRPDRAQVDRLVSTLQVPPLVATLLVNRGHQGGDATARHLSPDLHHLHDPGLLPGMAAATARLGQAIEAGEPILIHGDYDVDGITGTTLLVRLLRHLGADVHWHVPDRFTDGYSFGEHSLVKAREVGAKVVVSVDNGTSAVETITQLLEAGVETIVTDHHEPPRGPLPPATAIVNPKLADSTYPFRELCGGAVAFKLAWGLAQERSGAGAGGRVSNDLRDLLVDLMGLVALATVCDVVPLIDENRVLGRFGLKALSGTTSPGLRALLEVAGLDGRQLVAEDVGFQLGPRLNAAGRMVNAGRAIEVLLADDRPTARKRARALDELNLERKRVERELLETVLIEARRFEDPERYPVLVVAGQGWHQGVIGIIAARLAERMNRPALVIGLDGEVGRASARSVEGVSILELMHAGAAHMLQYGGHAQAAGCEVRADQVDDLREAICASARASGTTTRPEPTLELDAELPLGEVTPALMRQIDRLEPFGERNEKPVLYSPDVRLAEPPRVIGADGSHLLLRLRRGEHVLKALAFGMAHRQDELALGAPIHAVYTPRWNTFRGETNLELLLADFRVGPRPSL